MRKIVFCIIAVLFFSCSHRATDNELLVFKALDESLVNATKTIERSSELIYASLEDRAETNYAGVQDKIWLSKALLIEKYSDGINTYVDSVKTQLKKDAGLTLQNDKEKYREGDKSVVVQLFINKGKAEEIHQRLNKCKIDLLSIDASIDLEFRPILLPVGVSSGSNAEQQPDISLDYFDGASVAAALAILSRLQNYTRTIENRMLTFCHNHRAVERICYFPSPIITQSSTYVRAGENIRIDAGIGWVSLRNNTEIIINQKKIHANETGIATYQFKTSDIPGKYKIPVQIAYTDQDGRLSTYTRIIDYTVADETLPHK